LAHHKQGRALCQAPGEGLTFEKVWAYADLHGDKRVYLGAVAGVVFSESEKTYALKRGFYVIEPSGDPFSITKPEGKYHPHEW
jgi:hypothetical protein